MSGKAARVWVPVRVVCSRGCVRGLPPLPIDAGTSKATIAPHHARWADQAKSRGHKRLELLHSAHRPLFYEATEEALCLLGDIHCLKANELLVCVSILPVAAAFARRSTRNLGSTRSTGRRCRTEYNLPISRQGDYSSYQSTLCEGEHDRLLIQRVPNKIARSSDSQGRGSSLAEHQASSSLIQAWLGMLQRAISL